MEWGKKGRRKWGRKLTEYEKWDIWFSGGSSQSQLFSDKRFKEIEATLCLAVGPMDINSSAMGRVHIIFHAILNCQLLSEDRYFAD